MSIVSPIALDFIKKGGTTKAWAQTRGYKPNNVTQVVGGHALIRDVELDLIRDGYGPMLKRIQKEKGIFDPKRYKEMLAQIKKEKEATTNGNKN